MNEIKFTIPLNPVTKKNSQQIILVGGRPRIIPSKKYKECERDCMPFLRYIDRITGRINVKAVYFMKTRRRVDLTNLHEALHDILVHYGILEDDNCNIIYSTDGSYVDYDKDNPRTEVTITYLDRSC